MTEKETLSVKQFWSIVIAAGLVFLFIEGLIIFILFDEIFILDVSIIILGTVSLWYLMNKISNWAGRGKKK